MQDLRVRREPAARDGSGLPVGRLRRQREIHLSLWSETYKRRERNIAWACLAVTTDNRVVVVRDRLTVMMVAARIAGDACAPPIGGTVAVGAPQRSVTGATAETDAQIDRVIVPAAGLDRARLDVLSDEFLQRVSALEQKNLALETLRKLLTDQIKASERTNLVQAQRFREALEQAILGYTNKQITTAQRIARLLELAKWVREAKRHGAEPGLSNEETAFYDALAQVSAITVLPTVMAEKCPDTSAV